MLLRFIKKAGTDDADFFYEVSICQIVSLSNNEIFKWIIVPAAIAFERWL